MKKKSLNLLLVSVLITSLFSCGPSGNKPNVELIQDMMVQPAVKPQKEDDFFKGGISSLVPPENTQPVGKKPYPYLLDLPQALLKIKNPIPGDKTPEVLLKGQKYYVTQCAICHGEKGLGDGPIKPKYPMNIPSLVSDKVKGLPDAHVYHIIMAGQGLMGSYGSHIPEEARWPLVNYIRHLQK